MLKLIQYFIWIFVNNGLLLLNMGLNLTPKYKNKFINVGLPIIFLTYYYIAMMFYSELNAVRFSGFILELLYVFLLYKEKFLTKLLVYLFTLLIGIGIEAIIHGINYLISGPILQPKDISIKNTTILSLYNLLLLIAYSVFTYFYGKRRERVLNKTLILFIFVPFSQFILCESLFYNAFDHIDLQIEIVNQPMLIFGIVLSVVSDVLLFGAMKTNNTANLNKQKIAQLEYNQSLSLNYYEGIKNNAEQLMKYKHDFNNRLNTVYQLIESGDENNKRDGMKLLNEIRDKNKSNVIPLYCKNPVVNAVLFDKMAQAEKCGVELTAQLKIPEETGIELTDLCSIFTNLLDNAIKSASQSFNNKVELMCHTDMGYLFVNVKNYPDTQTQLKKATHIDSQIKPSQHGYGLDILNDISKKYDGKLDFLTDENSFEAMCSVKLSQQN